MGSAAGFGVNGTFASIQQTQTQITIKSKSLKGTTLQELKIGGDDQDDADVVSSKPIKVAVRWEELDGRAILVVEALEAKNKAGSVSVQLTRRYLDGDSMIAERTNCSGTVIRLFFCEGGLSLERPRRQCIDEFAFQRLAASKLRGLAAQPTSRPMWGCSRTLKKEK